MTTEPTRDDIIDRSNRLRTDRRFDENLDLLERAIERFPRDQEMRIRYASALRQVRPDEVPEQVRAAVDLDPDNPTFLTHAASLMFRSGEIDAARAYVGHASHLAPEDFRFAPELANLGGVILAHDGDVERALEALDAAFRAEPHNGYFGADLALELAKDGRVDDARAVLDEAFALSPNHLALVEVREWLDSERS